MYKYIHQKLKSRTFPPLWDLLRYLKFKWLKNGRFSLDGLDKKLEAYLDHRDGFFVELGANDGFTQSNTLYFELKKNWRGVLIEPSPNLYMSCQYFRGKVGNEIFCNACVPFDYEKEYVSIEYANLMSVSKSLNTDLNDEVEFISSGRRLNNITSRGLQFGAKARTITSILLEANAPKYIDLLSLDVEGAELDVLKGLDFDQYSFKYICIETRSIETISMFFEENGYKLIDKLTHHDYLFKNLSNHE